MCTTEGFQAREVMLSREREREPGEKGLEGCERSKMKICGERGVVNRGLRRKDGREEDEPRRCSNHSLAGCSGRD